MLLEEVANARRTAGHLAPKGGRGQVATEQLRGDLKWSQCGAGMMLRAAARCVTDHFAKPWKLMIQKSQESPEKHLNARNLNTAAFFTLAET